MIDESLQYHKFENHNATQQRRTAQHTHKKRKKKGEKGRKERRRGYFCVRVRVKKNVGEAIFVVGLGFKNFWGSTFDETTSNFQLPTLMILINHA